MLAGAVTFDGDESCGVMAEEIARRTARYPHLRERLLHSEHQVVLYAIVRAAEKPVISTWTGRDGAKSWLLGDVNYFPEGASEPPLAAGTLDRLLGARIAGRWLAVQVEPRGAVVRIATDRLGLAWLYIARIPNGYIFSSDYAAVAQQLKRGLSMDRDNLLLELALGYVPDDSTIFREIQLAPAGAVLQLSASGLTTAKAGVEYGDRLAGLAEADKYDRLDAIYDGLMRRSVTPLESDLMVSISAGYDSRYALAFLGRHDVKPPLCTFGHPDSDEVLGARSVCAKIGQSTKLFSFEAGDWGQWRRGIQQLGNSGMIQWSGWAESWCEFIKPHGRFPVIGYLGDALSGKHLGRVPPAGEDWLQYWERWSTSGGWLDSPLLLPDAKARLQACLRERFQQAVDESSRALPHQQALHLDLHGRQRRWVATQPNLMSRFVTPVLFFYDRDLFDFWTNLPADDLLGQRLYRSYAQNRFPRLFPRGERERRGLFSRALVKALAVTRQAKQGKPGGRAPKVIDHTRILVPNRQEMLDLVDRVAPMIGDILDVSGFREQVAQYGLSATIPSGHLIRAINVFFLLDLGNGLPFPDELSEGSVKA